ncbi:protein CREG1 [Drosophila novamexicana]|uniref:protein CREG1 n=1 Tax=Drosophila novamexicana TaxID=47314 RepID=UPI0011E5FB5F|nr:protein CREG1 [Drosophila novamexicana]XP_030573216.1 protein CREG1 [Drosophila novamexicana]
MHIGCQQLLLLLVACVFLSHTQAYSALQDARIIAEYKRQLELNHAKIARQLVHRANWASVGSISTNEAVKDYPMVNIISIDDNGLDGNSTGVIRFLLTDLDFTGPDWQKNNKVTFMFTAEQTLSCTNASKDPMEPTCARVIISGQVKKLPEHAPSYKPAMNTFINRHPAAARWIIEHHFYLCELNIRNIFVLDFYGGPHQVNASDYYAIKI